jgi:malate/lactate dehydrogenase
VKSVSKVIVDNIGGTEFGPAASFRDIVRAIIKNTHEVFPVATPMNFGLPEPTFVSVPLHLSGSISKTTYTSLPSNEKSELADAAKAIYETYKTAIDALEKQ